METILLLLLLLGAAGLASAQRAVFTYQGHLLDSGQPANGNYDLRISLADALTNGNYVGAALTNNPVLVSNGLFRIPLGFDSAVFDGSPRWLEVAVRTNGSTEGYAVLDPRQAITVVPYAAFASTAEMAGTASNLVGGGVSLTNISGANINAGSITSRQMDPATDAAYRQGGDALTNRYSLPVLLGDASEAHFYCAACTYTNTPAPSYNNLVLGINHSTQYLQGGSILVPDRGGLFWLDGSSIWGWNDHAGYGYTPRNELQILGNFGIAVACYGANGLGGVQMGGSGGYHDKFWFQYDTGVADTGLGFSKLVQFVTRSGTNYTFAYSAIRAVAADTLSPMNTLNFYSGTPSAIDNSGGNLVGTMLTNGWNLRGRLVTEHAAASASGTNCVLDWSSPSSSEIALAGANVTFVTTNLPAGTTNNESRTIFIKSGALDRALQFPSDWTWVSETGAAAAPANLLSNHILILSLTAIGPGDTNVFASYKTAVFNR